MIGFFGLTSETKIILTCVPAVAVSHWILRVCKRRPFNLQELILVSFDVVAVITGVSIFIQAFKVSETSPEHAVWSGIAGVCIAMLFLGSRSYCRLKWKPRLRKRSLNLLTRRPPFRCHYGTYQQNSERPCYTPFLPSPVALSGHRSSIFSRMCSASLIASEMAHSIPQGLLSGSWSLRAARIVAANRIAYFRCSSI